MACGTPVVATNTEGLRDLVIDGVDGALAPWGDADAFAAKVVDQLRRPRRISRRRLREISANYAWPNVAPRYVEVYRAVLASRRARPD
jgi:glycosyltransferase involved in cell wall biosynthesis